ncbi:MAG: M20/M25/M40 family metallo-hydrolase, partial [Alphaproteobacteria bacterium]|nr:M20/M25/M40 family metallo-hydrolase [Alphaproteobacteria bacterium]
AACGDCLEIATPTDTFTAPRMPTPTPVGIVMAIQKGTTDPNRVIIISGHLDSRVSDVQNATADAPGANDDASGVAAVMEAARILSKHQFDATLVFAALTGEEQGLYGGKVLADYAKAKGWKVEAVLNNDIIGNIHGSSGVVADRHVRIFTEGVRSLETQQMAAARQSTGGEVDSPSRNLARFIDAIAERHLDAFDVMMVYRRDRFGRGGDQVRMLEAGFPSVRVTEAAENYTRQHQDLRTEDGVVYGDTIDGVDFPYLARVTRLNIMTMAALASAPPPPLEVRIEGAVSPDTKVSWTPVPGAELYVVHWRATTEPVWTNSTTFGRNETSGALPGVVIDDWFFGVSTVGPGGYASPVQYAGIVGAFFPPVTD